jgi:surface protein
MTEMINELPDDIQDIIKGYVPDFVVIDDKGKKTAYNNDQCTMDFTNATSIVVNIELRIVKGMAFSWMLESISGGPVTLIGDMKYMFFNVVYFNSDVSEWDTSKVTNMKYMFHGCDPFNSNLSRWDTSKVTDMSYMFAYCAKFESDLSQWDVSQVTNMKYMFYGCRLFNSNLSRWDTSKVTDMSMMFYHCDSMP